MDEPVTEKATEPHLKPRFLSHGTVECHDIQAAKRLYTELLGMEVVQTSDRSLIMRLNSETTIVCVETKGETKAGIYSHFGFDYATEAEVDAAHAVVCAQAEAYDLPKVSKPVHQHGTYAFYLVDADGNWWEILTNPAGGYSYVFDIDEETRKWRDQNQGRARRERWAEKAGWGSGPVPTDRKML